MQSINEKVSKMLWHSFIIRKQSFIKSEPSYIVNSIFYRIYLLEKSENSSTPQYKSWLQNNLKDNKDSLKSTFEKHFKWNKVDENIIKGVNDAIEVFFNDTFD